jgi:hypothetical protein
VLTRCDQVHYRASGHSVFRSFSRLVFVPSDRIVHLSMHLSEVAAASTLSTILAAHDYPSHDPVDPAWKGSCPNAWNDEIEPLPLKFFPTTVSHRDALEFNDGKGAGLLVKPGVAKTWKEETELTR